jgi:flagellar hook-associated protein 3 FlgL
LRITTSHIFSNALRGLRRNQQALDRVQLDLATGRRLHRASDDPADAARVLRLSSQLEDVAQYRRNGVLAGTRLTTAETVLGTIDDLITQARELADRAATLDPSDPERQAAANTIADLREQVIGLANTRVGEEFLFGGARSGEPPFDANGIYQGSADARSVEVDEGVYVETDLPGEPIFAGMLEALNGLAQAMASGDDGGITRESGGLEQAAETLKAARTEIALKQARVDQIGKSLARRAVGLADRRDAIQSVDPTEAAVEAVAAQTALERAYAAVSRILESSILSFLK